MTVHSVSWHVAAALSHPCSQVGCTLCRWVAALVPTPAHWKRECSFAIHGVVSNSAIIRLSPLPSSLPFSSPPLPWFHSYSNHSFPFSSSQALHQSPPSLGLCTFTSPPLWPFPPLIGTPKIRFPQQKSERKKRWITPSTKEIHTSSACFDACLNIWHVDPVKKLSQRWFNGGRRWWTEATWQQVSVGCEIKSWNWKAVAADV